MNSEASQAFENEKRERIDPLDDFCLESLILAQNERWRHGLGMQVERVQQCISGARVRNAWVTCLQVWNSSWKRELIPDVILTLHGDEIKAAMRLKRGPRPIR